MDVVMLRYNFYIYDETLKESAVVKSFPNSDPLHTANGIRTKLMPENRVVFPPLKITFLACQETLPAGA